jgi:GNAT superfamily N-acetyltransferase
MHPPTLHATTSTRTLRLLTAEDLPEAAEVFARAFDGDAVLSSLLADDRARRRLATWTGEHAMRSALPYASVWGIEDEGWIVALAVWHPPGVTPASLGDLVARLRDAARVGPALVRIPPRLATLLALERGRVMRLVAAQSSARRVASTGPAWHLAFLAVAPDHQGKGHARRLLDHVLERCDEDATAAWLETTDPSNPPRYERFGFRTLRQVPPAGRLPGVWVMRREPVGEERGR